MRRGPGSVSPPGLRTRLLDICEQPQAVISMGSQCWVAPEADVAGKGIVKVLYRAPPGPMEKKTPACRAAQPTATGLKQNEGPVVVIKAFPFRNILGAGRVDESLPTSPCEARLRGDRTTAICCVLLLVCMPKRYAWVILQEERCLDCTIIIEKDHLIPGPFITAKDQSDGRTFEDTRRL